MEDDGLFGVVLPLQIDQRRMQGEQVVERQRLGPVDGQSAAQGGIVGIADGRHGGQPVQCPAQDDGDETRIAAAGGAADGRHEGAEGGGRTGGGKKLAAALHLSAS